jgi:hypothetical protein
LHTQVRDQIFLADEKFSAIAADEDNLFVGSPNKVLKIGQIDLKEKASLDISGRGYNEVAALSTDGTFVYVVASGKVEGHRVNALLKIDKSMNVIKEMPFEKTEPIAYSLAVDEKYIYTGHYSFPGKVCRTEKSLSDKPMECVSLNNGENDIRQLELDPHDPLDEFIYANTNTAPGVIVKIRKATMKREAFVKLSLTEDYALSGIELDPEYLVSRLQVQQLSLCLYHN